MTVEVRELAPGEWDLFYQRLERAFGLPQDSPEERALWDRITDRRRMMAAWERDDIVGTAGSYAFRMTVPGGALLDVPGVSSVSVQPTHRRRGVLTAMMRRQLDDFRDQGHALAILTASEHAIYGRFGYGTATRTMHGSVDTSRVRFDVPAGADAVTFRLAPATETVRECEAVYGALVAGRAGMLARQPGWEDFPLLDPPSERERATALLSVLAEVDGQVRGYARYAVKVRWPTTGPDSIVQLRDVEALDPAVYAALWNYLGSIDLTSNLTFASRPADDPMVHIASDVRRCRLGFHDGLQVRLLDVGSALAARTYTTPVDVVLAVEDPQCPENSGHWHLSGDQDGAVCRPTTAAADLALPVRSLAAAYLGGPPLRSLAAAGPVRELRTGALSAVSRAFHCDTEPWLPHDF